MFLYLRQTFGRSDTTLHGKHREKTKSERERERGENGLSKPRQTQRTHLFSIHVKSQKASLSPLAFHGHLDVAMMPRGMAFAGQKAKRNLEPFPLYHLAKLQDKLQAVPSRLFLKVKVQP